MTETAWRNWAGNQRATPARFATPTDAADVATEIGRARRDGQTVRAVGSGHSFTGAAVTSGVMLRPDAMRGIVSVDAATGLVEVAAGTPLHELNPQLAEHGLALEIMGDIDRQTIAGAVSTGTHGSGRNFGSVSTQVRALELVLADGSIVTCSETERPELFAAARVSVGALGVVTALTVQCVPLYALHAVDEPRPLDATLDAVDEMVEVNDHFEFFWFPHSRTALTRRFQRLPRDATLAPMSSFTRTLDDRILTNVGFEAMLRVGARFPRTVPSITRFVTRAMSARDFTDLAPNVFASARNVRFREGEYAVPRDRVVDVLRELDSWVARHDEPVSFPFEVRFGQRDDIWLSPAYERDVAYVAFHQYHRMPHERWFGVCEDVLGAADGRPHWGKMHRLDADELRSRYPRFDDFVELRDQLDPAGVFANAYLRRTLGGYPATAAT
jgi:L-gulonolactone oxidase